MLFFCGFVHFYWFSVDWLRINKLTESEFLVYLINLLGHYLPSERKTTMHTKITKKTDYIIEFMEDGRKIGGRYASAAEAIKINSLFGKVKSVSEGSLRDGWRNEWRNAA